MSPEEAAFWERYNDIPEYVETSPLDLSNQRRSDNFIDYGTYRPHPTYEGEKLITIQGMPKSDALWIRRRY